MRVLHLVESVGAGVMTSLAAMAEATPDLEHHLAVWPRREHDDNGAGGLFAAEHRLPAGLPAGTRGLRSLVALDAPDVVHAHSSYAGMLARVAGVREVPLVYSPHCFGFERRDLGAGARRAIRTAERVLARRTTLVVAVSPHEAALARALGHDRVVVVPNRPLGATQGTSAGPPVAGRPLEVVTVGRVGPQKDWTHFLQVREHAELAGLSARWTWVGGGEEEGVAALRAAGVAVTGWIPHREVARRLASAHAYLHTAAWESAPMSVLEAAATGLPLAVRAIAPLTSLGTPGTAAGPAELAAGLARLTAPTAWYDAREASLDFAATHSRAAQRAALLDAYAAARSHVTTPAVESRSSAGERVTA